MAKKRPTKAEREEWKVQRAEMRANAQRTRELAERAQAKLKHAISTGRRKGGIRRHESDQTDDRSGGRTPRPTYASTTARVLALDLRSLRGLLRVGRRRGGGRVPDCARRHTFTYPCGGGAKNSPEPVRSLLYPVSRSDIALTSIERFLTEDEDDGEEEADES